jgi:hypothetical protein
LEIFTWTLARSDLAWANSLDFSDMGTWSTIKSLTELVTEFTLKQPAKTVREQIITKNAFFIGSFPFF